MRILTRSELENMTVAQLRSHAYQVGMYVIPGTDTPIRNSRREDLLRCLDGFVPRTADVFSGVIANMVMQDEEFHRTLREVTRNVVEEMGPKEIQVKLQSEPLVEFPKVSHTPLLERLVRLAASGKGFILVGPAGCGKSTFAEMTATALGWYPHLYSEYNANANTSKADLLGYGDAHGNYHVTDFLERVMHGGMFVADDMERAGDPGTWAVTHNLLAKGRIGVPLWRDNPMLHACRRPPFVFVGTANRLRGADGVYVTSNALDGAFLNRFACRVFEVEYDRAFETGIARQAGKDGTAFLEWAWEVREKIETNSFRHTMTSRHIINATENMLMGSTLIDEKRAAIVGWTMDERKALGSLNPA